MGEFADAGEQIILGLMAGLYQAEIDIMYVSQNEVPVDTGTLRSSGRALIPERHGNTITGVIGYGYGEQINPKTGELAAQYAVPVHERLDQSHAPPTKAKFLEDPVHAFVLLYGETVGGWIKRWMRDYPRGRRGGLVDFEVEIQPSAAAQALASNAAAGAGGDARRAAIGEMSGIVASLRGKGV